MRLQSHGPVRFSGSQPPDPGQLKEFLQKKLQYNRNQYIQELSAREFRYGKNSIKGEKILIALFLLEVERREAEGPYLQALAQFKQNSRSYQLTHRKPKPPKFPSHHDLGLKIWRNDYIQKPQLRDLLERAIYYTFKPSGLLEPNKWETRYKLTDDTFNRLEKLYAQQLSETDTFSPQPPPSPPTEGDDRPPEERSNSLL